MVWMEVTVGQGSGPSEVKIVVMFLTHCSFSITIYFLSLHIPFNRNSRFSVLILLVNQWSTQTPRMNINNTAQAVQRQRQTPKKSQALKNRKPLVSTLFSQPGHLCTLREAPGSQRPRFTLVTRGGHRQSCSRAAAKQGQAQDMQVPATQFKTKSKALLERSVVFVAVSLPKEEPDVFIHWNIRVSLPSNC